jgi:hypothetical protein
MGEKTKGKNNNNILKKKRHKGSQTTNKSKHPNLQNYILQPLWNLKYIEIRIALQAKELQCL